MWETALAFAIWGTYGSVLTTARIDPALTAAARSVALGIFMTTASALVLRLRGPREITAPIPWRSAALWLSGSVLLIDEVLYSVSAVSGPVAIIGLAYGCVPILAPLLVRLAGGRADAMGARHWLCVAVAFVGNALVFSGLEAARIHFTMAALSAFAAGLLFTVMPVCSARLQQTGLGTWAVLKAQGVVSGLLAIPLLAVLIAMGLVSTSGVGHDVVVTRSFEVGALNAVVFAIAPFYLWYRGIARCGVARTSICAFAEPLVATLFSLFVLRDAPMTPSLIAGAVLVLGAIGVSAWSAD
jgi:drug/metabolite transporter (DMT)-like permease